MIINITHKTIVGDVQRKLSMTYPFLKIEFCKNEDIEGERVTKRLLCDPGLKLLDFANKPDPGWIVLHPWYTIRYIKEVFKNRFGLCAQIFRKESDQWIQVLDTDAFSLEEQNETAGKITDKGHLVPER